MIHSTNLLVCCLFTFIWIYVFFFPGDGDVIVTEESDGTSEVEQDATSPTITETSNDSLSEPSPSSPSLSGEKQTATTSEDVGTATAVLDVKQGIIINIIYKNITAISHFKTLFSTPRGLDTYFKLFFFIVWVTKNVCNKVIFIIFPKRFSMWWLDFLDTISPQ